MTGVVGLVSVNVESSSREVVQARMQSHEQGGVPGTLPIAQEPIVPSEAQHAWAEAIGFTRDKSPASFDQWFSGVQFDGLTDGVLSLRARDEFVRQWVEDYFLPTVTDRLREHTGLSIQVRWIIDGALEHPVADRPLPFAPVRPRPLSVRPGATDEHHAAVPTGDARGRAQDGESGVHPVVPEVSRVVAVAQPIEGLNQKYTFANFVVGPSNQLAHAASMDGGTTRSSSAAARGSERRTSCTPSRIGFARSGRGRASSTSAPSAS
jgi:hypothetical protein